MLPCRSRRSKTHVSSTEIEIMVLFWNLLGNHIKKIKRPDAKFCGEINNEIYPGVYYHNIMQCICETCINRPGKRPIKQLPL